MAAVSRLAFLSVLAWLATVGGGLAQKQGGVLRQHIPDNPASLSIHEESTVTGQRPAMAVFNNLMMFDQHVARHPEQHDVNRARSGREMVLE
jgi:peptide/nickel transport system substrate-binding protein